MSYTKLFQSILTSTIWVEDDKTRIVWITMLALADKNGEVQASVPGLARMAGVDVAATEAALDKFKSPDTYSRTKDDEGRRIEEIDGGWAILNHSKYREMASIDERKAAEAERKARYRAKVARNTTKEVPVLSQNAPDVSGQVTDKSREVPFPSHIAEEEAEADTEAEAIPEHLVEKPMEPRRKPDVLSGKPDAGRILGYLNEKAGREFRHTDENLKLITMRLASVNGDVEGVMAMIDRQVKQWGSDPRMAEYLRPTTLFGKEKFGGYYDLRSVPVGSGQTIGLRREDFCHPQAKDEFNLF